MYVWYVFFSISLSHLTLKWCLQYVGSIIQEILMLTMVLLLSHRCLHRRAINNTSATIFIKLKKNWNTERFCIIFVDMMRTSRENSIEQLSSSASSSKQQRDRKLKLFEAYIPTYRLSQRAEFFSFSISLCSLDGGPYTYVMNVLSHHR